MQPEIRGRRLVIAVIAAALAGHVFTLAVMLAWGFDSERNLLLESAFSIPSPRLGEFLTDQLIGSAITVFLSWALYTGRSWARWTWVLMHASVLALSVFFGMLQTPLLSSRWFLLPAFLTALSLFSLGALLTPAVGDFLRAQRRRRTLLPRSAA